MEKSISKEKIQKEEIKEEIKIEFEEKKDFDLDLEKHQSNVS